MTKPYNADKIEKAVEDFGGLQLAPVEGLLAAGRLLVSEFRRFREHAAEFRSQVGDETAKNFAHQELNDLIYDLQDIIAPAVRTYNSLLRDPEQKGEGPDGGSGS